MKKIFLIALCFVIMSCTKKKTDYEAEINTVVTEHYEFKEAVAITTKAGYTVSIEALNGTFYKGYNEIRLKVIDKQSHAEVKASEITFLPINTNAGGQTISCPHSYNLEYNTDSQYYSGYTVFTKESNANENWDLYLNFTINGQTYALKQNVVVQAQTNKNLNMTEFTGKDDEKYVIALVAPQKPKIAENQLIAGIYKYDKPSNPPSGVFPDPSQFSYSEVSNYVLQLDPRMPEPSMGNHSSLNNKDLTQRSDGLYAGVVNYTMTGNWTLNFILQNKSGRIIKGTEVSTEFTPGVEGARSELFIDILF